MPKLAKRNRDPFIMVFCIFIGALVIFFVAITFKVAFSPVCSADTQNKCVIDTWSIAGLTAAVFGIAATLLAFLGAFAVAYWWANLDQKVDKQVEARTNELIEQRIKDQEVHFQAQIADNVKKFEEKIAQLEIKFQEQIANKASEIDTQVAQLKESFQFIRKELVIAAMISPPWEVEEWAKELLAIDPSSEVAVRMVMSYLNEVDYFLPDPSEPSRWQTLRIMPESKDALYYWEQALIWQERVRKQNIPGHVSNADWQLDHRRQRIEEYKKQKDMNK
jgi:hypothetical protein